MHKPIALVMLLVATGSTAALAAAQDFGTPGVIPAQAKSGPPLTELDEPAGELAELQRCLSQLKGQREALAAERTQVGKQALLDPASESQDVIKLRLRVAELLAKLNSHEPQKKSVDPVSPGASVDKGAVGKKTGQQSPPAPEKTAEKENTDPTPIDPAALGHVLFRGGDYEHALKAYRLVNLTGTKAEERAPIEYLIASCLRKLGRNDEAAAGFRLVANSKDEQVSACAQWELAHIAWCNGMQAQLKELRERRNKLGAAP